MSLQGIRSYMNRQHAAVRPTVWSQDVHRSGIWRPKIEMLLQDIYGFKSKCQEVWEWFTLCLTTCPTLPDAFYHCDWKTYSFQNSLQLKVHKLSVEQMEVWITFTINVVKQLLNIKKNAYFFARHDISFVSISINAMKYSNGGWGSVSTIIENDMKPIDHWHCVVSSLHMSSTMTMLSVIYRHAAL